MLRENATLAADMAAIAGMPLRGEHAFPISQESAIGKGFIKWRLEVRTRLLGPDYRTRFPLADEYSGALIRRPPEDHSLPPVPCNVNDCIVLLSPVLFFLEGTV